MSKIDDIRNKTDEQRKARQVAEKSARAIEVGFDDIEDFELWQALEDLRNATKARRREEAERDKPTQKIQINNRTLAGGVIAA